jgi:hypothetical protein
MTMKLTTKTLTPQQWEKMQIINAYHDGFLAACEAMRKVYSAAEHKEIRRVIDAVDHTQGEPSMVRQLRREMKAKGK